MATFYLKSADILLNVHLSSLHELVEFPVLAQHMLPLHTLFNEHPTFYLKRAHVLFKDR